MAEEHPAENNQRFEVELEFVQGLANPNYLNFLAQRGYFEREEFVKYLEYLLYWKDPQYSRFIRFPQCLHFLELLQSAHFRRELSKPHFARFIQDQQLFHWMYYNRNRAPTA